MSIERVLVFCASSRSCHPAYHDAARRFGRICARAGLGLVYGGGSQGSMGALAAGALEANGEIHGVMPRFMDDLEWGHGGLTRLEIVDDMRKRKERMLVQADAVVALPGGCGTFEELFEAITFKRLGLYNGPIVLVNTRGYFDPCMTLLERAIEEHFMNDRHRAMWQVVDEPEQVREAFANSEEWDESKRSFAVS